MLISWVTPAALAGLGLIALPIAIHLLVRQHTRTLAYPSLRFLRETQLAAFRRRTIEDALLLACRVLIVAAAATALAGPVLQTASRTAAQAARTSRAIVGIESSDDALLAKTAEGAFRSATFRRAAVADALSDAVRWLDQQPASAREIVIGGALRRGTVLESDLASVPASIGIRFEAAGGTASADQSMPVLARRGGRLSRVDRSVHFESVATRVAEGVVVPVPDNLIRIVASPSDAVLAEAALEAVLTAGVPWSDFEHQVVVAWDGADGAAVTRESPSARVIRMPVPERPAAAADAVFAALRDTSPTGLVEPAMISDTQLAAWSRPPGPPSATAPISDEGDRRWLWAMAIALLGVEWWVRRG